MEEASKKFWYAIYTRPRAEKKVKQRLEEKGIETFLPLLPRLRVWKDRKKKVEMPLFSSYVFARFDYRDRFDILPTEGIVKIVSFNGQPAIIPDWQIAAIKRMLEHPESLLLEGFVQTGELVEVVDGPFKGMRGTVRIVKGTTRLTITIDSIKQSVSVEVLQGQIKRLAGEAV